MRWMIVLAVLAMGAGPVTQPTTRPSTQPAQPDPSLDEVESLGRALAPLIEARMKRLDIPSPRGTTTIKAAFESADVVRTESLARPVVAEIVFSTSWVMDDPGVYHHLRIDLDTVRLFRSGGKWKMVSGRTKCQTEMSSPQGASHEGEEHDLSNHWLDEELSIVNRGDR